MLSSPESSAPFAPEARRPRSPAVDSGSVTGIWWTAAPAVSSSASRNLHPDGSRERSSTRSIRRCERDGASARASIATRSLSALPSGRGYPAVSTAPRSARRLLSPPRPGFQPASTSSSRHWRSSRAADHGSTEKDFDQNLQGLQPRSCAYRRRSSGRRERPVVPRRAWSQHGPAGEVGLLLPGQERRFVSRDAQAKRRHRRTMRRPNT